MSTYHTVSIPTQELSSMSEQNIRLNQTLVSITLDHQTLIQQNRRISQELNKKDYALIQSTLRQKNLQHTLQNVRKEYAKLQDEYKSLFDWLRAEKKLELREVYKKESQLSMDLAFIERESYRESRRAKNEQLSLYQQRIINLLKENQTLKDDILRMTSEYNSKIHELKTANLQYELKLKNLKFIQEKLSERQKTQQPIRMYQTSHLQLEIKLENLKEKLQFYSKQNQQLRQKNHQLAKQNKKLTDQNAHPVNQSPQPKIENKLWRVLETQNCSIQFITEVFRQNSRLQKQIQQISTKYTLLAQTYPKLIEEYETISELEANLQKLSKVKQLENQLSEAQLKSRAFQKSLNDLETKYLAELKSKEALQYKTSVLMKRFNEVFIKMNPYFDIYQYEALELDESMWKFFEANKDYKQLKEYESKILQLKRETKETKLLFERKQRQLRVSFEQKERECANLNQKLFQTEQKLKELTDSSLLMKDRIKWFEMMDLDEEEKSEILNSKKIDDEISLPILQAMVQRLQLQRQKLLQTIYSKDQKIAELSQQLRKATLDQLITTKAECDIQFQINDSSLINQFTELLKQNQNLQKKYDTTVEGFSQQINKMQLQLNQQHNIYQMQVRKYEVQYENKLVDLQQKLDSWMTSCQQLRTKLDLKDIQTEQQKHKNQMEEQNINQIQNMEVQSGELCHIPSETLNRQQATQPQNVLVRHPSQTNLQKLTGLNQQGNNKLIGESTVQNLTSTLKKYEQQMSEVLTMCAKLSEEYSELKKKVNDQEQLQKEKNLMKEENFKLLEELSQTKKTIEQKNRGLSIIENLYKTKSAYCEKLKSEVRQESSLLEAKLNEQVKRNEILTKQLAQIKEKLYQLTAQSQQQQYEQQSSSLMGKREFETIFVMHANRNKEISQLVQKNKLLENKVESLLKELNLLKQKSFDKNQQQISPLEKAEFKHLTQLLHQTNLVDLIKRANQIIQNQTNQEKNLRQQRQLQEEEAKQDENA